MNRYASTVLDRLQPTEAFPDPWHGTGPQPCLLVTIVCFIECVGSVECYGDAFSMGSLEVIDLRSLI